MNNLTDHSKGKSATKDLQIGFNGRLAFYKNKKEGYITLKKTEEKNI